MEEEEADRPGDNGITGSVSSYVLCNDVDRFLSKHPAQL